MPSKSTKRSPKKHCDAEQLVKTKDIKNKENIRNANTSLPNSRSETIQEKELRRLINKIACIEKILTVYQRLKKMEYVYVRQPPVVCKEVDKMRKPSLCTNYCLTTPTIVCGQNNAQFTNGLQQHYAHRKTVSRGYSNGANGGLQNKCDTNMNAEDVTTTTNSSSDPSHEIDTRTIKYRNDTRKSRNETVPKRKSLRILFKRKQQVQAVPRASQTKLLPGAQDGPAVTVVAKPLEGATPKSNDGLNTKNYTVSSQNYLKKEYQEPCDCKKTCLSRSRHSKRICYLSNCCSPCDWRSPPPLNAPAECECCSTCSYIGPKKTTRNCSQLLTSIYDSIELQKMELCHLNRMIKECLLHVLSQDKKMYCDYCNSIKSLDSKGCAIDKECSEKNSYAKFEKSYICCKCFEDGKSLENHKSKSKRENKTKNRRWFGWCCRKQSVQSDDTIAKRSVYVQCEDPNENNEIIMKKQNSKSNLVKDEQTFTDGKEKVDNSKPSVNTSESNKSQQAPAAKESKKSVKSNKSKTEDPKKEKEKSQEKKRRCWLTRLCKYCC